MSDDTDNLRKTLQSRESQQLMRQFLKNDGPKGNGKAYTRGHEFNFTFTQAERDDVNFLMEKYGQTFEEAFDNYLEYKRVTVKAGVDGEEE